jgi:hypothetical protein
MYPNLHPRSNANSSANANANRRLTSAQIYLLEMYNLQYNEIMQQINARYIDAANIRNNMNAIISITFPNVSTNANVGAGAGAGANANTTHSPATYNNSNNPMINSNFTALNARAQYSPLRTASGGLYRPSDFPASWLRNNSFNSFFDNVVVSPSTEQINTSTRTLRFGDIETPINDRCPISFETFTPEDNVLQIIHCGHIFNPCEIAVWFRSNVGCPVCRYDIRNHRHNHNSGLPLNPNMEETKEDNGEQEFKESDPPPMNARANDNVESNTEALIEALLYVLMPGSTGRHNNMSTTSTTSNTSNASSISYDPSNNMYFFDYYLGGRS